MRKRHKTLQRIPSNAIFRGWVLLKVLALLLTTALTAGAQNTTSIISPVTSYRFLDSISQSSGASIISPSVSYQYLNSLVGENNSPVISQAISYLRLDSLANAGTTSPIISQAASYQYFDWPDATEAQFISSKQVSYFYDFGFGPAFITSQPSDQFISGGQNATFTVQADGEPPLSFQWQFNGHNIPAGTGVTLILKSVTTAASGKYSVIVSNPYGPTTSAPASLAVLADGANGNPPSQPTPSQASPPQIASVDSLVLVTHGFAPNGAKTDESWVTEMADSIQKQVPRNWTVVPYIWNGEAGKTPSLALANANVEGKIYGESIAQMHYKNVHLISHSAGARFIETAAKQIKTGSPNTIIHCTFLDPYHSVLLLGLDDDYGSHANWSDCYFTQDSTGGGTGGNEQYSFNVDVDWLAPNHVVYEYGNSLVAVGHASDLSFALHGFPVDFYMQTVTDRNSPACAPGYGFAFGAEVGGDSKWTAHAVGNVGNALVLCGPAGAISSPTIPVLFAGITIEQVPHMVSDAAAAFVKDSGAILKSILPGPKEQRTPRPFDLTNNVAIPAWIAIGISVSNIANIVQFDASFIETNEAEGFLSVYWNTNELGFLDERVTPAGRNTFRFALPETVSTGDYTLTFRIDSFAQPSSISISNVAVGYAGLTDPIRLNIQFTNGMPLVCLTAPPHLNYFVQSSTNLVDWVSAALLSNTNGTVSFTDTHTANEKVRFYRAFTAF